MASRVDRTFCVPDNGKGANLHNNLLNNYGLIKHVILTGYFEAEFVIWALSLMVSKWE